MRNFGFRPDLRRGRDIRAPVDLVEAEVEVFGQ
jgi:hypothetical protein